MSDKVVRGDCLDVMKRLPDACVDAIVTDPPYGLSFMGRDWDHGVPGPAFWTEALRVAKPGAHLVAFGGTRTYHRLACALEDAGWEIRDCLSWLYGSGFPKSLSVSAAIAKRAGGELQARAAIQWMQQERERLGLSRAELEIQIFGRSDGNVRNWEDGISLPKPGLWPQIRAALGHEATPFDAAMERGDEKTGEADGSYGYQADGNRWEKTRELREPATAAAKQWQGWGTALKPAWEPIILARKPLVGTVAANVLAHGTGAINVDACRIGTADWGSRPPRSPNAILGNGKGTNLTASIAPEGLGRWPANVALDEEAAAMLDEQTGTLTSGMMRPTHTTVRRSVYGQNVAGGYTTMQTYGDSGGASRFFYTAKASRKERGEGNNHPTVKSLSLMRWLVRMVTPKGGNVLDPFAGSGTTLIAAHLEGFDYLGIEREAEYVEIIRKRLARVEDLR